MCTIRALIIEIHYVFLTPTTISCVKKLFICFLTFSLFVGIIVRKRATADFISDVTNTIKGNLFFGRKYELCWYYIIRYNFVS